MSAQGKIVPVSRALLPQAVTIVERALVGTPYIDGALEALRAAVNAADEDRRALACIAGERLDGVVVFGFFGGASGAGRLQLAVVGAGERRSRIGHALAEEVIALLRGEGARFVLAELPDDARALPGAREFLESLGFTQESRVEHFYRDGVAMIFMRRELDAG